MLYIFIYQFSLLYSLIIFSQILIVMVHNKKCFIYQFYGSSTYNRVMMTFLFYF
jgi:hypothetical protein